MQRIASKVFAYGLLLVLFGLVLMLCVFMARTQSDVPPAVIFAAGCGLYTMIVLYVLHRRAGTLVASPEERRLAGESEAEPMDAM